MSPLPRPLGRRAFAMLVLAAAAPACVGQRGHPVRTSLPPLTAPEIHTLGMHALDEPGAAAGAEAMPVAFLGMEGLFPHLAAVRAMPQPDPRAPVLVEIPNLEAAVVRRHRGHGYGGPVRLVGALGVVGHVPLRPAEMAAMMQDEVVEKQILAADVFSRIGTEYVLRGSRRDRYRAEFLRIGDAFWIYDLRFTFSCERVDVADGRVLLRYDPRVVPAPEHVTLWRGLCLLEPEGTGTRVTEILIIGTDLNLPFFLVPEMRRIVRKRLADRAQNLWIRAWAGR
jgi:hypothetical protein